jgi:hypothetical protein
MLRSLRQCWKTPLPRDLTPGALGVCFRGIDAHRDGLQCRSRFSIPRRILPLRGTLRTIIRKPPGGRPIGGTALAQANWTS